MSSRLIAMYILIVATTGLASAANLITNGDFETGDFTDWTTAPAPGGTSFLQVGSLPAPHDTLGVQFGAVGSDFDSISQSFATTPGGLYDLSFFYQVGNTDAQADNHFVVFFDGVNVFDNLNANPGFGPFTFTNLLATGSTTTLEFDGRNLPGLDYLDDVSVTPSATVPEAGTTVLLLLGAGLMGLAVARRTKA
jgi:hypothetical protein